MDAPVYPFQMLRQKTAGTATVTFSVDPLGRTHIVKLESQSSPEFGYSTCAMVASWTFAPATREGKGCWALLRWDQEFDPKIRAFPDFQSERRIMDDIAKGGDTVVKNELDLDKPLLSRFQPGPVVPESTRSANLKASATIEFVVDHAGHAQLPQIASATDIAFGWAAATAVAHWQFTPPQRKGLPVDVFARVPMKFSPEKTPVPDPQGTASRN